MPSEGALRPRGAPATVREAGPGREGERVQGAQAPGEGVWGASSPPCRGRSSAARRWRGPGAGPWDSRSGADNGQESGRRGSRCGAGFLDLPGGDWIGSGDPAQRPRAELTETFRLNGQKSAHRMAPQGAYLDGPGAM